MHCTFSDSITRFNVFNHRRSDVPCVVSSNMAAESSHEHVDFVQAHVHSFDEVSVKNRHETVD